MNCVLVRSLGKATQSNSLMAGSACRLLSHRICGQLRCQVYPFAPKAPSATPLPFLGTPFCRQLRLFRTHQERLWTTHQVLSHPKESKVCWQTLWGQRTFTVFWGQRTCPVFWGQRTCPMLGQSFHTTPRRSIPPVLWFLLKPVAKLGAILSGRTARKWWRALPSNQRQDVWSRLRERWYILVLLGAGLCVGGVAYYNSHVEDTPLTGRRRYIAVTHEQFLMIADAEAETHLETYKDKLLPENHPYYQRVRRVADRLVTSNKQVNNLMAPDSWKYFVIDEPSTINAFVLPTGHVFVFRGIIDFAQNDDQLAIIIAHEMAHALLSHGIEQVSYVQLLDFLVIVSLAALWCIMPTDGISLITQWFYNKMIAIMLHMPYSRMLEKEADKVGLQLAARACYDVREGTVFWARMGLNEEVTDSDGSIPEWLSTHPSFEKRVELFDFLIPKVTPLREEAQCPRLPQQDPRQAIKMLSAIVDDHVTAKKSGQNLSKIKYTLPAAADTDKS